MYIAFDSKRFFIAAKTIVYLYNMAVDIVGLADAPCFRVLITTRLNRTFCQTSEPRIEEASLDQNTQRIRRWRKTKMFFQIGILQCSHLDMIPESLFLEQSASCIRLLLTVN